MIEIKVLGPGCPNCVRLENLCKEVVEELGIETQVEKITDINEYGKYGVMLTPGLVVNGKVMLQGKLPTKATLTNWLKNEA
jgi:small redox-active disulfide protein 2